MSGAGEHAALVAAGDGRLPRPAHGLGAFPSPQYQLLAAVRETIAADGPLAAGDFEVARPSGGKGWWNWKPVHHALHHLWMKGDLTIHSRRHFHKRNDLLERAIPAAAACEPVSKEEFALWHVRRSLRAMGAATEKDLAGYLTFPRTSDRRAAPPSPRWSNGAR